MRDLNREEHLQLLRFVCTFAWTDLEVVDAERALVRRMLLDSGLDKEARIQVEHWLETPPAADDVDPLEIPHDHREQFLAAARAVVAADGQVVEGERDVLEVFEQLLHDA